MIRISALLIVLCGVFLSAIDVNAQSYIRKRYKIHLGGEVSKLGFGLTPSYSMNEYISLGLAYFYVDEKTEELKKSGSLLYITLDYFPIRSSNFNVGYGYGGASVTWKAKYCDNYVLKTNCNDYIIDWPYLTHKFKAGYRVTGYRSRVTATFQLYYMMIGDPNYKASNSAQNKALESRYQDEVNDYKSQYGLVIGLGYLF